MLYPLLNDFLKAHISLSTEGPFMKIAKPPLSRHDGIRGNVFDIGSNAIVITAFTLVSKF